MNTIPFIDFAKFDDADAAREIGHKLFTACRDVGFAYLINLTTEKQQDQVNEMFQWSRKLFALSEQEKMLALRPKESWWHRGYSSIGKEQISQMEFDPEKLAELRKITPDFKESFDLGNDASTARLRNIWLPEDKLPGFRDSAKKFFEEGCTLEKKVLTALAMGIPGIEDNFFDEYHTERDNQIRLLHYPSAPVEVFTSGAKGRVAAHTDFGTCTLLFQDPQDKWGGLEVEDPHNPGHFVQAPPVQGTVVFNIGDFLMRWSNGKFTYVLEKVQLINPNFQRYAKVDSPPRPCPSPTRRPNPHTRALLYPLFHRS
jgi:isopenicillin N synthase-like dioxygenase